MYKPLRDVLIRPQYGQSELNMTHPLASGMVSCVIFNMPPGLPVIDQSNYGRVWDPVHVASVDIIANGYHPILPATEYDACYVLNPQDSFTIPSPYSVLVRYYSVTAASYKYLMSDGSPNQGLSSFQASDPNAVTAIGFQAALAWVTASSATRTKLTGEVFSVGATIGTASSATYWDGLDVSTTTLGSSASFSPNSLGGVADGGAFSYSAGGYLISSYIWNRKLTGGEMLSISNFPYQIFNKMKKKRYFFAAAAAAAGKPYYYFNQ